jgi:2C-methyl-D-erythritol 2,4-cyclodiphosphate synthase
VYAGNFCPLVIKTTPELEPLFFAMQKKIQKFLALHPAMVSIKGMQKNQRDN